MAVAQRRGAERLPALAQRWPSPPVIQSAGKNEADLELSGFVVTCPDLTERKGRIMATRPREKFEIQVNPEILSAVKAIAQSEGRDLPALVDEALADLIEKRTEGRPRAHVMTAYETSHETFAPLYKKLAE
jgi:hypothetical protein